MRICSSSHERILLLLHWELKEAENAVHVDKDTVEATIPVADKVGHLLDRLSQMHD